MDTEKSLLTCVPSWLREFDCFVIADDYSRAICVVDRSRNLAKVLRVSHEANLEPIRAISLLSETAWLNKRGLDREHPGWRSRILGAD